MLSFDTPPIINTIPILSVAGAFSYVFDIANDAVVQVLWAQFNYTSDAVIGARQPVIFVLDETSAMVSSVAYFATTVANATLGVIFSQGNTVIPATVLGTQTALPSDGLFVKNNWSINISAVPLISAGDVFSGFMQTRGTHGER